ncbi:hypothetical protein FE391_42765 [Nonomuraea sp. KC401]|nr:hypothetical protein [Nonomuraea sp. K271]TLF53596.1 hypothetical protein FE391_42765 [Nonomuraea sp. KC401]
MNAAIPVIDRPSSSPGMCPFHRTGPNPAANPSTIPPAAITVMAVTSMVGSRPRSLPATRAIRAIPVTTETTVTARATSYSSPSMYRASISSRTGVSTKLR